MKMKATWPAKLCLLLLCWAPFVSAAEVRLFAPEKAAVSQSQKININTAGVDELTKLPRIGPKIAERIIAFREEHGGFKSVEELMNVQGIGQKTFEKLKDQIEI